MENSFPDGAYENAVKAIKQADMFIVAGTSLKSISGSRTCMGL